MSTHTPDGEPQSAGVDDDNETTLRRKELLQKVIVDLARYGPGRTPADLRSRLEVVIAQAGLPPQPPTWVEAVAAEASAGRITVLDARFVPDDTQESRDDQHQGGGGEGPDIGPQG